MFKRLHRWRETRAHRLFHRRCDRLGVPGDVRRRILKGFKEKGELPIGPDWYAGRQVGEER